MKEKEENLTTTKKWFNFGFFCCCFFFVFSLFLSLSFPLSLYCLLYLFFNWILKDFSNKIKKKRFMENVLLKSGKRAKMAMVLGFDFQLKELFLMFMLIYLRAALFFFLFSKIILIILRRFFSSPMFVCIKHSMITAKKWMNERRRKKMLNATYNI